MTSTENTKRLGRKPLRDIAKRHYTCKMDPELIAYLRTRDNASEWLDSVIREAAGMDGWERAATVQRKAGWTIECILYDDRHGESAEPEERGPNPSDLKAIVKEIERLEAEQTKATKTA